MLKVVFTAKKLPKHVHFLASSVIKAALATSNPALQKKMYDYSEGRANKEMKPFCGGIYIEDYELQNDEFIVNGKIHFTISSPNYEFLLYAYNGFVTQRTYKYKQYELNVDYVKIVSKKIPTSNRVLFKTMSPIVVKDAQGKFLDIDDENYVTELNYAANECMKSVENRALHQVLIFTPVVMKKKVVQLKHEKFAKLNDKSILYMNAYEGSFVLEGHPEDLAILSKAGLGVRKALLMGSIEVVNE